MLKFLLLHGLLFHFFFKFCWIFSTMMLTMSFFHMMVMIGQVTLGPRAAGRAWKISVSISCRTGFLYTWERTGFPVLARVSRRFRENCVMWWRARPRAVEWLIVIRIHNRNRGMTSLVISRTDLLIHSWQPKVKKWCNRKSKLFLLFSAFFADCTTRFLL